MINKKNAAGGLQNISPKVMMMTVLLVVMGILWSRVLLQGAAGPAAANAQDQINTQDAALNTAANSVEILPVRLPVLPGRNDRITNDLFGSKNWTAFEINSNVSNNGVKIGAQNDSIRLKYQAGLERIADRLKLEAVICNAHNQPFQAFVDGKILSVGSALTVQEGPDQYVLTLEKISKKEVVFSWNEMSVVLKLAETFEF